MSQKEIYQKVSALIADRFEVDPQKITSETNIKDDLAADSIDLVEFVLELEDEFHDEIPDEDAEKLKTVGEVVQYIDDHQ